MKNLLFVLGLSFVLAGCATFSTDLAKSESAYTVATTATVPASTAQIAVSSFEVVEAASTGYFQYCFHNRATPACNPGTIANPGPLRLAIKYIRQGRNARDTIKAAGKAGALISTTVYDLLTSAIANLSTTPVSKFGVQK